MANTPPAELKPGDPLTAAWLNQLAAFVRANRITVGPDSGIAAAQGPDGIAIGLEDNPPLWVELTYVGAGTHAGAYSWMEKVAIPAGWTDGRLKGYCSGDPAAPARTVPDPAFEANGNSSLTIGFIVDATRDKAAGRLTFRARPCPSSGGGS